MGATLSGQRRWWTLFIICVGLMVITIDNTILNVAIPTLSRTLHASNSQLQWIVDAYTLVFAGLLLTAGSLGDRFGRKKALALGLSLFALGSLLSATATTAHQLIATRAFMGVGGAFIMPATLSIITNVFTVASERARAIAVWAGVAALGVAVGPVIGGWLLEHFYWGSVFIVNLPIVALALAGGYFLIPDSRDPSAPRLDLTGAGLSIVGLVALLYGIIQGPIQGWRDPKIVAAFIVAVIVLAGFVVWELRSDHPMLDMGFFKNARFTAASLSITAAFFALFGSIFFLTQLLQLVMGYTPLQAGLRILPQAIVLMLCAPLSARVVELIGTKKVVTTGLALVAVGLLVASRFSDHSGYGLILTSILVLGVGMGFTMAPATESIMGSLPRAKAGVGSAMNDTTRMVGGSLGVAVLGSILSSVYGTRVVHSLKGTPAPASAVTAAKTSLGAAFEVARQVGGLPGARLHEVARHAFILAADRGFEGGAAIAVVGGLIAWFFLPARAVDWDEAQAAPAGVLSTRAAEALAETLIEEDEPQLARAATRPASGAPKAAARVSGAAATKRGGNGATPRGAPAKKAQGTARSAGQKSPATPAKKTAGKANAAASKKASTKADGNGARPRSTSRTR
jgi:EmrB/QacA subfamily drug resistance transporter